MVQANSCVGGICQGFATNNAWRLLLCLLHCRNPVAVRLTVRIQEADDVGATLFCQGNSTVAGCCWTLVAVKADQSKAFACNDAWNGKRTAIVDEDNEISWPFLLGEVLQDFEQ